MRLDPIGRDEAREMARRELEKKIYHRDRPSWLERIWERFADWLRDLGNRVSHPNATGNGHGWVSIVVIVLIAAVAIALIVWLMWGRLNPKARREALLDERPSTSLDHRTAAERHAAAGQWAEAIRERLRAIARDLEERAVLGPRPGRTADELAAEAGAAVPELADGLREGVRIFDDVWYGDRPGTPDGYTRLRELDERLQAAKPKPLEPDDPVPAGASAEAADDQDGGTRW